MGREENVAIFRDTEHLVKTNKSLAEALKWSVKNQLLIPEYMQVANFWQEWEPDGQKYVKDAQVIVSKKRSYEAAAAYKGKKVCVLNFASATNPGGGVVKGSSAQEECLCRCSTLYFSLNVQDMWSGFYSPHRETQNPLHNDDCIYTPQVVVFKSDTAMPKLLPPEQWYLVNVITCAAPNLRLMPGNAMNAGDGVKAAKITDRALLELHEKRLSRILDVAAAAGNEVVILGAFGCGAFENNPEVVAQASKNVIEKYKKSFETIEFAVYCSPRDEQNYLTFERVYYQTLH